MANKIEWTVEEVEVPKMVKIAGTETPASPSNSSFRSRPTVRVRRQPSPASFKGTMIVGPIGKAVAKNAKADLEALRWPSSPSWSATAR